MNTKFSRVVVRLSIFFALTALLVFSPHAAEAKPDTPTNARTRAGFRTRSHIAREDRYRRARTS